MVAIWPGFHDRAYGIAIDVGSTPSRPSHQISRPARWRLRRLMNPQIRFGEDLMSRVSYVMMNPGGARRK